MNRSIFLRIVLALVLVGALAGLGALIFRAGMQRGVAIGAQMVAVGGGAPGASRGPQAPDVDQGPRAPQGRYGRSPMPYGVPPYGMGYYRPHFFGFGFFNPLSCLFGLFLLFLAFVAVRLLFGHRPYGWGRMHHGPWGQGDGGAESVPPMFAEWHRRMHDQPSANSAPAPEQAAPPEQQ